MSRLLTAFVKCRSHPAVNCVFRVAQESTSAAQQDGRIEAENNAAERALRSVAIGRKNFLHLGSDARGNSAAVIYTLIGTAKLNGINPQQYLRHMLERIADHPINCIDEFLPRAVAAQLTDDEPGGQDCPMAA